MADQNVLGTDQIDASSGGEVPPETQIPPVEEAMPKAMTTEERVANFEKIIFPKRHSETGDRDYQDQVIEIVVEFLEDHATTPDELRQFSSALFPDELLVNAFDELGGGTPLHWAVRMEDIEMVKCIVAVQRVDVYAKDRWWDATALHWAVRLGNMPIVVALLPKCDKDTTKYTLDVWGLNAGDYALLSGTTTNVPMLRKAIPVCNIYSSNVQGEIDRILEVNSDAEAKSHIDVLRENWYEDLGHPVYSNSLKLGCNNGKH